MNIKGQGYSLILVQGHSESTLLNFLSFTACPIEAKFYLEPPWDGGKKIWSNGVGDMTKLAVMPYMVKT